MPRRHHVSPRADLAVIRSIEHQIAGIKPRGLWYEVDGDWRRWCRDDGQTSWINGHYLYALALDPAVRLLRVCTGKALDDLTTRYAKDRWVIDWPAIAAEYDGIEIAPYQWSRRLSPGTSWYYGWDCASGCVWTPRDSSLSLVGPADAPKSGPAHA